MGQVGLLLLSPPPFFLFAKASRRFGSACNALCIQRDKIAFQCCISGKEIIDYLPCSQMYLIFKDC